MKTQTNVTTRINESGYSYLVRIYANGLACAVNC